jgi:hypothetical protein
VNLAGGVPTFGLDAPSSAAIRPADATDQVPQRLNRLSRIGSDFTAHRLVQRLFTPPSLGAARQ